MRQEQRLATILERLAESGSVTVTDLAEDLDTSVASIRRDLQSLEEQKLLKRTHGGAIAAEVIYELPLRYRVGRREEKRQIAEAAAKFVTDSVHSVGLNGGTTTTELARLLAGTRQLKIVTNALNIASDLCPRPTIDLVVTGGSVRPESYELVGPIADRALAGISLDAVFLGVDGIDVRGGITTHDEVEAHTDNCLLRTADRVVVLADGSKVGKRAFSRIAGITDVHVVVTDSSAPAEELDRLRGAGVEVVVA